MSRIGLKAPRPARMCPSTVERTWTAALPGHWKKNWRNWRQKYKTAALLLLEQIRTVDRRRLRGYIGQINKKKMKEIDTALAISVGLRSLA